MGYSGLAMITTGSHFGKVDTDFGMDHVVCQGTEGKLIDCSYRIDNRDGDCRAQNGAGVYCKQGE